MSMSTKNIAGINVTLETGKHYLASRPMAERGRKVYPITITGEGVEAARFDGLTYDEANMFLSEFNNGRVSFDGRVW